MTPKGTETAAKAGEVLKLAYGEHLGIRAIARRLKMSRKTVRRILDRDRAFKEAKVRQPRVCYSRLLYIEFTLSQAMGSFLRCMERALRFFGGATLLDIFDNMKTVVLSHTPTATVFNQRFLEYARVRGVRPGDLLDLNAKASAWRDTFANNREHEVTGKVPALVFEHEEKAVLAPVRDVPFNTDDVDSAVISKTFRVRFDRNLYSVPPQLVGQTVLVRATHETVLVFLETKQVACHRRSWGINDDVEDPAHRALAAAHKPRARAAGELPPGLAGLGETGARYFKVLAAGSRSINREITKLVLLIELFGETAAREAVDEVMRTGHVGAEYVEYVLRHKRGLRPAPPPLRLGVPALDDISFREPDLSQAELIGKLVLRVAVDRGADHEIGVIAHDRDEERADGRDLFLGREVRRQPQLGELGRRCGIGELAIVGEVPVARGLLPRGALAFANIALGVPGESRRYPRDAGQIGALHLRREAARDLAD